MAWVEPELWYRDLPTFYAAAGVFIINAQQDILLVKPTYREHWAFPGGMVEAHEAPHDTAAREAAEELGFKIELGKLLVVGWAGPMGERPSSIMYFLFDGGALSDCDVLDVDGREIERAGYFSLTDCKDLLPAYAAGRAAAAVAARQSGRTEYLPE